MTRQSVELAAEHGRTIEPDPATDAPLALSLGRLEASGPGIAAAGTAAPTARRRIPLAVWAVLVTIVGYWVVTSWQSYQATFAKLSVVRS